MPDNVLAREVIEILTRGMKNAEREIDSLKKRLQATDTAGKALQQRLQGVSVWATRAFAVSTAAALGFVRAGLQGTQEGERMALAFKSLGQQIASVALPRVLQLTDGIERLSRRLANMNGAEQQQIRNWVEAGAVGLGLTAVLSKINPSLGVAAGGFFLLAGASEEGRQGITSLTSAFKELGEVSGPVLGKIGKGAGGALLAATGLIDAQLDILKKSRGVEDFLRRQVEFGINPVRAASIAITSRAAARLAGRSDGTPLPPKVDDTAGAGAAGGMASRSGFEAIADTYRRVQAGILEGDDKDRAKLEKLGAIERLLQELVMRSRSTAGVKVGFLTV